MAKTNPPVGSLRAPEEIRRAILADGGGDGFWVEADLPPGPQGPQGPQGKPGAEGPPGADGADGADGTNGTDGADGTNGVDGKDGADGLPGVDGKDGEDGLPGADGADGVGEAPVDGLQYARQDEGWVEVEGSGFDGDHVLTGDPGNPPEGWVAGQLLYDGVEDAGDGSDGGPHQHDEYLPLTGGTLTGDLVVHSQNRAVRIMDSGTHHWAELGFTNNNDTTPAHGYLSGYSVTIKTGSDRANMQDVLYADRDGNVQAYGNLQVDGTLNMPNCRDEEPTISAAPNMYLTSNGNVRFTTFVAAPRTFNIADGIDAADVLDRAETATMPAVGDEGVATADVEVEGITVNEVVTALLLKVKELSAEVEELKGN